MGQEKYPFIEAALLDEIPSFETFFKRVGMKRGEGAVFGLLTLSTRPLNSEEIEQVLGLSQSAVSMALKTLGHYGAIQSQDQREKRGQIHSAKTDALSIVSSVFRKREQEAIEDFKSVAKRTLEKATYRDEIRKTRLRSLIVTCEMAEVVMNFVLKVASKNITSQHQDIVTKMPKMLDAILFSEKLESGGQIAFELTSSLASRLKEGLTKIKGDHQHG